jgi:hypothetical protein
MPSYHCSDNVSIEWNKGNQYVSELITHMPSYHCSDNVNETKLTRQGQAKACMGSLSVFDKCLSVWYLCSWTNLNLFVFSS